MEVIYVLIPSLAEPEDFGSCDKCGKGRMVKRYSPKTQEHFLCCDRYPSCRNPKSLPENLPVLLPPNAKNTSDENEDSPAIVIEEETTNLFPLILEPFPSELAIVPVEQKPKHPEAAFISKDELVCFDLDSGLSTVDFDPEHTKWVLYRNFYYQLRNVNSRLFELPRRFREHAANEVLLNDKDYIGQRYQRLARVRLGFRFRILFVNGQFYLCLNPLHRIVNRVRLNEVTSLLDNNFNPANLRCIFHMDGESIWTWHHGTVLSVNNGKATLKFVKETVEVPCSKVIPDLSMELLNQVFNKATLRSHLPALNLHQELKRLSWQSKGMTSASKYRMGATKAIVNLLQEKVFPFNINQVKVNIGPNPSPQRMFNGFSFDHEPNLLFHQQQDDRISIHVLEGLRELGSYEKPSEPLCVARIISQDMLGGYDCLFGRLANGVADFEGMEKHFGAELIIEDETFNGNDVDSGVRRFINHHRSDEFDVVVVDMPADSLYLFNPKSPYYRIKADLALHGYTSQMITRKTLHNRSAIWNIALDIFSKAGYTPWVLYPKEKLPKADLFIGLSYSSMKLPEDQTLCRVIGYANIFSEDGEWKFCRSGENHFDESSGYWDFDLRGQYFGDLVWDCIDQYIGTRGLKPNNVHIHYSKVFSQQEKDIISEKVRAHNSNIQLYFVSISHHHPLRLFDPNDNGWHPRRGTGITLDDHTLYLCTTGVSRAGYKVKGTPRILRAEFSALPEDHSVTAGDIAKHIYALTKLNWKSTRSFCLEPVTIKYAREIARMVNIFRQNGFSDVTKIMGDKLWWL